MSAARYGLRLLGIGRLAVAVGLISGCSAASQAAFEKSVYQQVHLNMPARAAEEHLSKLGLTCQRWGLRIDCSRTVDNVVMTCVQRVVLTPSVPGDLLIRIEVGKPACFGGFG